MKHVLGTIVLLVLGTAAADPPRADRYGDPLPPGAIARLGSLRLLCADDVANVVFTPDGRVVAAVQRNGPVQFWEAATGKAAPEPADVRFVKEDKERRRDQLQDAARRLRAANPDLTVDDLRVAVPSPDGALIVTSSQQTPFRVWDGRALNELPAWTGRTKDRTTYVAFSPDGKLMAATTWSSTQLWEVGPGRLRHTVPALGAQSFATTFSPDGKTLAVADGNVVTLWDIATGTPVHDFGHTYLVGALAFAPDGRSLISGASFTDRLIHRWDPRTGERLATWRGHTSAVYALAVTRDGRRAMSASHDGTCRLWDIATGREIGRVGEHSTAIRSADLAADDRTVATVAGDQSLLWEVGGTKPLRTFGHADGRVMQVALTPDVRYLLTRTNGTPGVVHVWNAGTGAEIRRLAPESGRSIGGFALSRDGRQVATVEGGDVIGLWDLESGRRTRMLSVTVAEVPRSTKWALAAFSPDGRCLAVGASDGSVRLVEVASGDERRRWDGHKGGVMKLLFSPDGALLASGSWDRTVLVWDVLPVPTVPPPDLTPLWSELGGEAATAFAAMLKLHSAGDRAVALLAGHVQPAPAADTTRIADLVADLDNERFAVREKASGELTKFGEAAEASLRDALKGSLSAEATRRVEIVLAKIAQPSGDRIRTLRAIEVLEHLATAEARTSLRTLAAGAPHAAATKDAEAALQRLAHR
jgi:WD40 repeat protein